MAGGHLTFVSDDGYTVEGRTEDFCICVEDDYSDIQNGFDRDLRFIFSHRLMASFSGAFQYDPHSDSLYKITQNFVEVVHTLVVKGYVSRVNTAVAYKVGVPSGAIYTSTYDRESDETTFKWTERIKTND